MQDLEGGGSNSPSNTESLSCVPHESKLLLDLDEACRDFGGGMDGVFTKQEASVEVDGESDERFHSREQEGQDLDSVAMSARCKSV